MRIKFITVSFNVTETLQNGNERRVVKTVYFRHRDDLGRETEWDRNYLIMRAERELRNGGMYRMTFKRIGSTIMNVVMSPEEY